MRAVFFLLSFAGISCAQSWNYFYIPNLSFERSEISLAFGKTEKINVTTSGISGGFSYSSSDAAIVEVDGEGNLKARKTGSATVSASTPDGNTTGTVSVTVPKGQMLILRGGSNSDAMFFNPTAMSFTALPTLPCAINDGANMFAVSTGTRAGKILILCANATTSTVVFDPTTLTFSSGPATTSVIQAGSHNFAVSGTKRMVFAGTSSVTMIYDAINDSFSSGPSACGGMTSRAYSFLLKAGSEAGKYLTRIAGANQTTCLYDLNANTFSTNATATGQNGGTANEHGVQLEEGANSGKILMMLSAGVAKLYDGTSFSSLSGGSAWGGGTFSVALTGSNAGRVYTALGFSGTTSQITDAGLTAWSASVSLPYNVGVGAHAFKIQSGPYSGKYMIVYNGSFAATSIFDTDTLTFTDGPTTVMGGSGFGAQSLEIP